MSTNHHLTRDIGFENNRIRMAWYAVLGVLLLVGVYFMWLRVAGGLASSNLTTITPWGTWVAFYIFFVGLSAGAFLVSTLSNVFGMRGMHKIDRDALFAAAISMVVALLFVWTDLGRMDRMYHVFLWRQFTSPLSWEVHAYVAYIAVLVSELYFAMRIDLARLAEELEGWRGTFYGALTLGRKDRSDGAKETDRKWLKRFGILGIPLAIFFVHGGTGILFAVAKSRPYWNSGLFPVIFIISAVVSGTALVMAVYVLRTKFFTDDTVDLELLDRLGLLLIAFVVADVAFTSIEALIALTSLHPVEIETWTIIATGEMAWSFWIVMVGMAWVVPMVLMSRKRWRRTPWIAVLVGLSVVLGIVGVRFNIVVPPLIVPVMHELPYGEYLPTLVEWGTSVGIVAVGLLIYTVGAELLPLTPLEGEHE